MGSRLRPWVEEALLGKNQYYRVFHRKHAMHVVKFTGEELGILIVLLLNIEK